MASQLRFNRLVVLDLQASTDWYDNISIPLGNRFRKAINSSFDEIEHSPRAFPLVRPDRQVRFKRVSRFPYLVLYRVEEATVYVLGVAHSSSDLTPWLERDEKF